MRFRLFLACSLLAAAACQPASLTPLPATGGGYAVSGVAAFDERTTQLAPDALKRLATVTLIDAANRTVASTRTDAAGAFTLLPGSGFTAAANDVFCLDVYKGTRENAVSADVARMRTLLQWTTAGWKSVSSGSVAVTPLTTAVSIIQGLQPGSVPVAASLDTVSGTSVTTGNGTLSGNWSPVYNLVRELLAKDQDPLARITYRDGAFRPAPNLAAPLVLENFRAGTFSDTQVDDQGRLRLTPPKPTPNDPASELEAFQADGVAPNSAGAVASDGTYLYVKSWSIFGLNNANNWIVKKIGTGFNGTTRGANYGTLGPAAPGNSISIAYYQGFLYIPYSGAPNKLFRISTTTGATASIELPVSLWPYDQSRNLVGGAPLVTCDGRYVYNLSCTIAAVPHADNGYMLQILDPAQGFKLVRQLTLDTNSFYTDGLYCDGTYLWAMEWDGTRNTNRIRRYRLADGVREAEWTFQRIVEGYPGNNYYGPEYNTPINGCWDPYNRVFWVGELTNERVHLLRGGAFVPAGTWTSGTLDAGTVDPHFGRLSWSVIDAGEGSRLSFQVRSADTTVALSSATWYGPTGTSDAYTASGTPLNPVHAKHRYLQVRATFGASNDLLSSPTLSRLSVEVLP